MDCSAYVLVVLEIKSSFEAVPRSLIDGARIDGLGHLRTPLQFAPAGQKDH